VQAILVRYWNMTDKPPTPLTILARVRDNMLVNGLRVIERDGYRIGEWRLDDVGRCLACDAQIPGVFAGPPGFWGNKRLPVRMS
jgi:pyruvate formate lyase activating enzyme